MTATAIRFLAAAAALLLALPTPCAAQSDAPVARPEVKPGDRWVYRRTDFWTNKVTGTATARVVFANDKVIQSVLNRGRNRTEIDETHTAEWNAIATADGGNIVPHTGFLKFPLVVGASYPSVYENTVPRLGAHRVKFERTAKVVGWEEIVVPAGRFRALKIEVAGSFQRLDTSMSGTATTVIWYVPEVKRWVKVTYEDNTFRGRVNWWGIELVEYKVQ